MRRLRCFPYLIQNPGSKRRLVLWQEATVVVGDHLRRILDGVACLLVGPGLLQDMSGKDVADVVGTMRQQALDGAATGVRVVDPIALDRSPPSLVKGRLVVRRILGLGFNRLHEKGGRIFGAGEQHGTRKRWIAGIAAGCFYVLVGVFGVTLAAVFMAFPATFITTLAGLALLGTIGGSLAGAMADPTSREAALITFLASAANIKLLGIGGAFWGLVIGLVAYMVLNGRLPRRERTDLTVSEGTAK